MQVGVGHLLQKCICNASREQRYTAGEQKEKTLVSLVRNLSAQKQYKVRDILRKPYKLLKDVEKVDGCPRPALSVRFSALWQLVYYAENIREPRNESHEGGNGHTNG